MDVPRLRRHASPARHRELAGAAVSVLVAATLFSRFGINGFLSRDEAIYAYGGRQLANGVPPYVSIFDPKSPMATLLSGVAVEAARLVDRDGLDAIRLVFFGCALLAVLATYWLALRLFGSVLAGLTAAVVLATSWPLAVDALSGPDAKTPGMVFAVLCMGLMVQRRWARAACLGSLAFLVWQPLALYAAIAVLLAVVTEPRDRRLRSGLVALVGAALPVALTAGWFAAVGAFAQLVEAAVVFPLTGVQRGESTLLSRVSHVADVATRSAGFSGVLFWVGLASLLALGAAEVARARRVGSSGIGALRKPLLSVVLLTLAGQAAYAATDFQSYPDLYPLLPYPAIGLAGAVAAVAQARVRRERPTVSRAARLGPAVALLMALGGLTCASWVTYTRDAANSPPDRDLSRQQANACALGLLRVPRTPLWALGDPTVLVLTHRRNPDRFVYLGSGVAQWKIDHTPGGLAGWQRQIALAGPSVVVLQGWTGDLTLEMRAWLLQEGFHQRFLGRWRVLLSDAALRRAVRHGITPTPGPTKFVTGPGGREAEPAACL
jgi:4-amino-4-deoxy-L-arabinose transferase-like glycosyltransferase